MEWIKVEHGLPPSGKEVIVWVIWENGTEYFTESEWYEDENRWLMGSARNFKVTHWMEIEEPKNK